MSICSSTAFCSSLEMFSVKHSLRGYAVAKLVEVLGTNQKVTGLIPNDVIGIFH